MSVVPLYILSSFSWCNDQLHFILVFALKKQSTSYIYIYLNYTILYQISFALASGVSEIDWLNILEFWKFHKIITFSKYHALHIITLVTPNFRPFRKISNFSKFWKIIKFSKYGTLTYYIQIITNFHPLRSISYNFRDKKFCKILKNYKILKVWCSLIHIIALVIPILCLFHSSEIVIFGQNCLKYAFPKSNHLVVFTSQTMYLNFKIKRLRALAGKKL